MIYKLQHVYYKIAWSYLAYDVSYRIELLSIPYDVTNHVQPSNVYSRLYIAQDFG